MAQVAGQGYGFAQDVAQAGQKVDLSTDIVDSYAAQTAIPYGRGVTQGTAANQVNLAAAAGTFLGVALFTHAKEQALAGGASYAIGDAVSTLAFGRLTWLIASIIMPRGSVAPGNATCQRDRPDVQQGVLAPSSDRQRT